MTPAQNALLGKAEQSLCAAVLLLGNGYADFAVGRAYFAMLYAAEALLLGEGASFSKHSAVIASFGRMFAKSGRLPAHLHRYLIEAHDGRNVGDYDTGPGLSPTDAQTQIDRSREFLAAARGLLTPPTRP